MTERAGPSPGNPGFLRLAKIVLQFCLTGLVTWFILQAVGFSLEELRAFDLSGLDVSWISVSGSALLLLVAFLYSASLWGLMVREMSGYEVGFVPSLRVFFTANLGRYLPGKVWQIAGLAYLAKGEGVPTGTAAGAAILGQAFSLAGATLVGAGVLLGIGRVPTLGGGWVGVAVLAVVVASTFPGTLRALLPFWFRLARQKVPGGFRPDHAFGVRWLGLYAVSWVLQGLAFWWMAQGLGFEVGLLEGVPSYSAAYVFGYLALFAPAGAGIREGILVVLLGPILGAGAAIVAVFARLWATVVELLPAVVLAGGYLGSGRQEVGEGGKGG